MTRFFNGNDTYNRQVLCHLGIGRGVAGEKTGYRVNNDYCLLLSYFGTKPSSSSPNQGKVTVTTHPPWSRF